jgi:hypothetical protein
MKQIIKLASLAILVVGLSLTSCRKDRKTSQNQDPIEADETNTFVQQSSDESTANNTSDESLDDAENALGASSVGGFKTAAGISPICGATIDSSMKATGKIIITYTGTSCDGYRNRSGSITIQVVGYPAIKWKDVGAVTTITYNSFKVTHISSGKSTTLNGVHTITNVSGGLVRYITSGTPIVRKIRSSSMSLTFDDGTVRSWSVARKRTWTGALGIATSLTLSGDTTIGGVANIVTWGTNRKGDAFTTAYTSPIVVKASCGWFAPVSGVKSHTAASRSSSITFGTDASGVPVASGCPNHYIVNWTSPSGKPKSYIGSY